MERTLTILIVLLVATGLAAAQGSSCPKIYVDGPMGTGEFGEPTLYSVRVEPADNAVSLCVSMDSNDE